MKHTIQQELYGVIAFVAVIWGTFFLGYVLPFDISTLGLTPRTLVGLVGIPAPISSPFARGGEAAAGERGGGVAGVLV